MSPGSEPTRRLTLVQLGLAISQGLKMCRFGWHTTPECRLWYDSTLHQSDRLRLWLRQFSQKVIQFNYRLNRINFREPGFRLPVESFVQAKHKILNGLVTLPWVVLMLLISMNWFYFNCTEMTFTNQIHYTGGLFNSNDFLFRPRLK